MQYVLLFLCAESCLQEEVSAQPYWYWCLIDKRKVMSLGKACSAEFHTDVGYSCLFFLVRLNEAFQNEISCPAR